MIAPETFGRIFRGERPEPDLGFLKDASLYSRTDTERQLDFYRAMFADIPDDTKPMDEPGSSAGIVRTALSLTAEEIRSF